ncbi:50S ribosomal protein L22 [Flavobacteriales bacterium]|nr:50S ribosomal protein L22 [Flavobacteriales bacterium]
MGSRKENRANERKEERKELYIAKLNNCPTSPRKMRLVADLVRGMDVVAASNTLQFTSKEAARRVEKLLLSAMNNYEQKSGDKWENANLFIKEIKVDSGRMLKRLQPAPQGRAHRIRKRSNHVTLVLGSAK